MNEANLNDERTRAEVDKLRAEVAKLNAEIAELKPSVWRSVAEMVKVLGAVFAVAAATYAAVTTYRITQLEARVALADKTAAEQERDLARKAASNARQEAENSIELVMRVEGHVLDQVKFADEALNSLRALKQPQQGDIDGMRRMLAQAKSAMQPILDSFEAPRIIIAQSRQAEDIADDVAKIYEQAKVSVIRMRSDKITATASSWCELLYFSVDDENEAFKLAGELAKLQLPIRVVFIPQVTRPRVFTLRLPHKVLKTWEM